MATTDPAQQPAANLMYLPQKMWSPRYEDSFYTVRVDGFHKFESAPEDAATAAAASGIGGHSHHPAFYYKVILNRSQTTKEMWRRFSQFQWLYRQVNASPPVLADANAAEHQAQAEPLKLPPGTCWWPVQSPQLAAKRVELLGEFLDNLLSRPGYASHPAVVAFLELDQPQA